MPAPTDLGLRPPLGYAGNALNRASERRNDAEVLAAYERDPRTRGYVIAGDAVVLQPAEAGAQPLFDLAQARALGATGECVFLGLLGEAARFAHWLPPSALGALQARADLLVSDLRSIAVRGLVEAEHLPPLAEGKAVLNWHARHRFCQNCGAVTKSEIGGWRRDCPSCKLQHFPRTDPVVIMLATDGEHCLLGRSHRFAPGMWSCLAGFVEPGETIEEAVRREVHEETRIVCGRVRYFASQPWPFPSSLMIGCHAQALSRDIVVDATELDDARWFAREEVAAMLARRHPEFTAPQPVAIAYHIMRAWVEDVHVGE